MRKIKTIFERNWGGDRKVINKKIIKIPKEAVAIEKLDGTNVRLTIRNHQLVRLEKRRNPSKLQKSQGIEEPWYVDVDEHSPDDKYIWEAARNTDLLNIPDGEWSGEAVGPKIQGNSLNLKEHTVILFSVPSVRERLIFENVSTNYEELKEWLPKQKSKVGNNCGIEGIVWWYRDEPIGKIKLKDFNYDQESKENN